MLVPWLFRSFYPAILRYVLAASVSRHLGHKQRKTSQKIVSFCASRRETDCRQCSCSTQANCKPVFSVLVFCFASGSPKPESPTPSSRGSSWALPQSCGLQSCEVRRPAKSHLRTSRAQIFPLIAHHVKTEQTFASSLITALLSQLPVEFRKVVELTSRRVPQIFS